MCLSDPMKAGLEAVAEMEKPKPGDYAGRIVIDVYGEQRMRIGMLPHGGVPEGIEKASAVTVTRALAVVGGMIRRLLIEGGHQIKNDAEVPMNGPGNSGNH